MIDLHAHVLPGVDDGPKDMGDVLELLRAAHADGIAQVASTSHVSERYPMSVETMERLVAEVGAAARDGGIPVDVLPGGELDLAFLQGLDDATLRRFGLGGNPSLLLVEVPFQWPVGLEDAVFRLAARGFTVLLAHPERNADVQASPERIAPLVHAGAYAQITAASVDGRLGRAPRESAHALLDANPDPTREEIVDAISGNICRCTGYAQIVEAIALAAERMSGTNRAKDAP